MIEVDPTPLYEQRLVVLLEMAPQSNKYRQIILNNTKFFNISNAIAEIKKDENGIQLMNVDIAFGNEIFTLPPEIKSIHV